MKTLMLVAAANQRRDYVVFAAVVRKSLPPPLWRGLLRFVLVILAGGGVAMQQQPFPSTSGADNPTTAVSRDPAVNARYRRKYCKLKRYIKDLLFENASLCDHVAQVQEHILLVKEERRYLLKKLLEHENEMETQLGRPCSKLNELIALSLPPKRQYKKRNSAAATAAATPEGGAGKSEPTSTSTTPKGKPRKPRVNAAAKKNNNNNCVQNSISFISQTMSHPTYPITVAGFTIYNLGEITPERTSYNSDYTIYPVGYTVSRPFGHLKDPTKKCIYTCRVLDNGPTPRFEIIPEHDPELTIAGNSTDACHATLLQCINASLNCRGIDGRPAGDWFFGLSHPTISSLIQSFPASKKCVGYRGIKKENFANMDKENDPTLNYDALQRHIALSAYHTVPEIKEEPPDELLDHSDGNSFSLS